MRRLARSLNSLGLSTQVIKTALAAGLSWGLAQVLLHSSRPYLAPLAAILTIQVTVADSLSRGGQRILGVVGGIFLSLFAVHFLGLNAWSIAILVLVGMAAATALGFGPQAVSQVAISALLVMSLRAGLGYAAARLLDTLMGALVALMVNAFIVPPDATPVAAMQIEDLSQRLADLLTSVSTQVQGGKNVVDVLKIARHLTGQVDRGRHAIDLARNSLRYSPLLRHRRGQLARLAEGMAMLERVSVEVRGLVRSVTAMKTGGDPELLSEMAEPLQVIADAIVSYGRMVAHPSEPIHRRLTMVLEEAVFSQQKILGLLSGQASPLTLREAGSILTDLSKMTEDLTGSADLLNQIRLGERQPSGTE